MEVIVQTSRRNKKNSVYLIISQNVPAYLSGLRKWNRKKFNSVEMGLKQDVRDQREAWIRFTAQMVQHDWVWWMSWSIILSVTK